jgi:hypothetical protein
MTFQNSFSEGVTVIYDQIQGTINFICSIYLTITLTSTSSLLVYKEDWSKIKLPKESET